MERMVWVDAWQLQCCGEPFAVGSKVAWTLAPAPRDGVIALLGADVTVDAAEEHHGGVPDDAPRVGGKVIEIRAVHVTGEDKRTAVLSQVRRADGREHGGMFLVGYAVRLMT